MNKKSLIDWAKDTLKVYHDIAKHDHQYDWKSIPAFYTQSNLNKNLDSKCIDVFIAGYNPGSDGTYQDMINNENWDINYESGMTPEQLISGNFCQNGNKTSWDSRNTWPYFKRLKFYFSLIGENNPLEDESRFILTNMSFFATRKECHLSSTNINSTILQTIKLIELSSPKKIILLSGKKTFNKLKSIQSHNLQLEIQFVYDDILVGFINSIPCLGLPHPSAHLTKGKREKIAKIVKTFLLTGNLDESDCSMPEETPSSTIWNATTRHFIAQELLGFIEKKHTELKICPKGKGYRHDWVGFSNQKSLFELYITSVKNNGIQIFTNHSKISELLINTYHFKQERNCPDKHIIDFSKIDVQCLEFIDKLLLDINNSC